MVLGDWVDRFAFWNGWHPDLQTLLIYGVGIAVYTALVFAFYQNISRRDPLHTKESKSWWGRTKHAAETALTFPVLSFGYFALMSLALFTMAKPDRATSDILLLSMACVLGVRVTAHLSEAMSNDIAKLLPLSLLAVVVVDPGYLTFEGIWLRVVDAIWYAPVLAQYFVIFILVEAALRAIRGFVPGLGKLTHKIERRRNLSKRAMLKDIDREHEHGFHLPHRKPTFHDHGPRDRTKDFLSLDENSGGKPGTRQGVGPAIHPELKRAKAAAEPRHHAAKPKAGPGGSGGKLSTW